MKIIELPNSLELASGFFMELGRSGVAMPGVDGLASWNDLPSRESTVRRDTSRMGSWEGWERTSVFKLGSGALFLESAWS